MKIPKTLKIGGKTINITIDTKRATKHGVNGQCFYDHNEILLDDYTKSGVTRECIEQTLIHEVIHWVNAMLSKNLSEQDSEDYVNPLSEILYQVFEQLRD